MLDAQGQGGLFDAPAETKPTNLKEGLAKIRKEKAAQATEANQEPIKSETRAPMLGLRPKARLPIKRRPRPPNSRPMETD